MIGVLAIATPLLAVFSEEDSRRDLLERAILLNDRTLFLGSMTRQEEALCKEQMTTWFDRSRTMEEAQGRLFVLWFLFYPYVKGTILRFGGDALYFTWVGQGSPILQQLDVDEHEAAKSLHASKIRSDLGLSQHELDVKAWDEANFLILCREGVFLLPRDRYRLEGDR